MENMMSCENPIEALRERLKHCTVEDIPELLKLEEDLQDVLIEYVALLRKNGFKTKLRKTWAILLDDVDHARIHEGDRVSDLTQR